MFSTTTGSFCGPSLSQPVSYSLLVLPPKKELRKKGYNMTDINTTSTRVHPLARWQTHVLKHGATYRDALDAVEEANTKHWGFLKARIQFSCGSFESFVRTNPNDPSTLKGVSTYDPNGVFHKETLDCTLKNRSTLLPRLRAIVDGRGHHLSGSTPPARSFHPQVLYKNCPPPVLSQAGYDFTPMSHNAFLLRTNDHPQGVRDVKSDFMKGSCDYRPRAYLRDEVSGGVNSRHCHCAEVYQVGDYTMDLARGAEIDHRNRTVNFEYTKKGTLKSGSNIVGKRHARVPRFPCDHSVKGACADAGMDTRDGGELPLMSGEAVAEGAEQGGATTSPALRSPRRHCGAGNGKGSSDSPVGRSQEREKQVQVLVD
ncbi:hypothetical protein, conserved [Trypanosoma brucei gambiense DAL972]|uniref:Uncharacterized protein n=2 Tax=Trypanosoma brucei TaxID=5691 RepID=C9ZTC1_TRYB9|nr:hypothetical protein, conserved [Trypanosoma brucei gambiense DAL972]RHW71435.1 hypothetical protein DPX39_070059600 [Trypanosoma brucei equiperdum]CBH12656.1 hypothetical protein, conserved [Trypanosoma brucei gambiense DAL972]|eukprot:XP_011774936.1 hypothetical protein, conserved [Trypanosoma brucei gambiense DAL972]